MKPNNVCVKFAKTDARIGIRLVEEDLVFIEGNRRGLEFLGRLFLAQARNAKDCGFEIGPSGSGGALFGPDVTMALHIHRLQPGDQRR